MRGGGGGGGEFPFHLVSPVPKIPSSPRQLISVRCVQLPLLFPSRAPLPEITPLRSTVLANLASHPRTAPRNRSPSQPANSRNQLTASSCYHGSSNAILFRRVDCFASFSISVSSSFFFSCISASLLFSLPSSSVNVSSFFYFIFVVLCV